MILLFTSIFASFSLIEDRNEGFLQGVLVSPAPPAAIAFGKVAGGALIATLQGAFFLLLAPLADVPLSAARAIAAILVMLLVGAGLSALGFVAAWRSNSIQGFHGVMNLVLLPMWFLSGAIFPAAGAHGILRALMYVNPMTYGVAALRHTLLSVTVCVLFGAAMFALAMRSARRATAGDLK
jgi:ABC-2 type transport system permease protein